MKKIKKLFGIIFILLAASMKGIATSMGTLPQKDEDKNDKIIESDK